MVDRMADDRDARIAQLEAENAALRLRESSLDKALAEALEQRTAADEVLRVIASLVTDPRQVLEMIATSAIKLCGAAGTSIWRLDGCQHIRDVNGLSRQEGTAGEAIRGKWAACARPGISRRCRTLELVMGMSDGKEAIVLYPVDGARFRAG